MNDWHMERIQKVYDTTRTFFDSNDIKITPSVIKTAVINTVKRLREIPNINDDDLVEYTTLIVYSVMKEQENQILKSLVYLCAYNEIEKNSN